MRCDEDTRCWRATVCCRKEHTSIHWYRLRRSGGPGFAVCPDCFTILLSAASFQGEPLRRMEAPRFRIYFGPSCQQVRGLSFQNSSTCLRLSMMSATFRLLPFDIYSMCRTTQKKIMQMLGQPAYTCASCFADRYAHVQLTDRELLTTKASRPTTRVWIPATWSRLDQ